jgi:glycosyltransferase involved in cell wall biosynthesis
LSKEGFDFALEIAGDGPLMGELKKLALEQDISSKVVFMGPMPHDKVFEWFQSLDIFVLACKRDRNGDQDGIPVVLMEAMAVRIPVVSTYISGIPELIKDNVSGLLAQPNDAASLADKIRSVLENPSRVDSLTEAAKERIREEFDVQVNTERLIRLFEG